MHALLARNKFMNIQLETISKKLDAREMTQFSSNDLFGDFFVQGHGSDTCFPKCLGSSEEQRKYIGSYAEHQRNKYPQEWSKYYPNPLEYQDKMTLLNLMKW